MEKQKKPYLSKTILANSIIAIVGVVSMLGFAPEAMHSWLIANTEMVLVAIGGLGVVLRLITKDKIEFH